MTCNPFRIGCLLVVLLGSVVTAHAQVTDAEVTFDRIEIGSQILQCFCADLWGTNIASATVTSPANADPPSVAHALTFDIEEDQWAYDEFEPEAMIESKYPDGTYRFDITFLDSSTETRFVNITRAFPPFPVVASLDNSALTWEPWNGLPAGLAIEAAIESDDEDGHDCTLLPGATSCALPAGFYDPQLSYTVELLFLSSGGSSESFTNAGLLTTIGAPASGRVPDDNTIAGEPLRIAKSVSDLVSLTWGVSCSGNDVDFAVYIGDMADYGRYQALTCSTGGQPMLLDLAVPDNSFFLVVPHNDFVEGSPGVDSTGAERRQGVPFCLLPATSGCS